MGRDFTYIDDIVTGVIASLDHPPGDNDFFHRIFNLGNDKPERLMDMIDILERELGIEAKKNFLPMQKGDVKNTWADISKARTILGYNPQTSLASGLAKYVAWRQSLNAPFS